MTKSDMVWIPTKSTSRTAGKTYHTSLECHHVSRETHRQIPHEQLYDGFTECSGPRCGGTADTDRSEQRISLRTRIEHGSLSADTRRAD